MTHISAYNAKDNERAASCPYGAHFICADMAVDLTDSRELLGMMATQ